MAAAQAFRVLTEFKFEVGHAIASASGLQGAVDKVSESAENLQFQLGRVGFGFAAQMGLVGGGLIGLLGRTLKQFDAIEKQQIKIGGIFFANKGYIKGVQTAEQALARSDKFMENIAKQAARFGLNEQVLSNIAGLSVGITAKEGISPEKNIDFARNILKAAPQLGIDAFSAQSQFQRALLGGASQGDPAFRALTAETAVFKKFAKKIGGITKVSKEFNKLPTVDRFNMLNEAFGQFTENASLLEKQANTISSLFLRIKQGLFGFQGGFAPIGESIAPVIKEALQGALVLVEGDLKVLLKNMANILKQIIPNMERMIQSLDELRSVGKNFQAAGVVSILLQILTGISQFLLISRLTGGIELSGIIFSLKKFWLVMGGFGGFLKQIAKTVGPPLIKISGFLLTALKAFIRPLIIIFTLFQLFTRASAIAKIKDAKVMPEIMAKFAEVMSRLTAVMKEILKPLDEIFQWVADLISPLFEISRFMRLFVSSLEFVTDAIINLMGIMSGVANTLIVPLMNLLTGDLRKALGGLAFDNVAKNFQEGQDSFFSRILRNAGQEFDAAQQTSGNTTNVAGDININQRFKEQLHPDRIAFSIETALKKITNNPKAAAATSGGSVRSFGASGSF